jgi:predicted PurR-regulated permease PerM
MVAVVEGASVLLLLSVFFAYLLAPAIPMVSRRARFGRPRRPLSAAGSILLLYGFIFVPMAAVWPSASGTVRRFVDVTAPETIERLFRGSRLTPLDAALGRSPLPPAAKHATAATGAWVAAALEREARRTLAAGIAAAPYAGWLAVTPIGAFMLLTGAPAFQRSAVRFVPRGHLQWRAEEYLRDVNSALAGYVRAQTAAGLIVGVVSVAGFVALRVPSGVALGVLAGILELVPALGPLTVLLVATAQAGPRALEVLVFLAALRLVQDYAVYPRLIRRGMHLSTPAVIVTIWAGAVLGQAAGVILAIPVAGFLSVSLRHLREYRDIERLVASASKERRTKRE